MARSKKIYLVFAGSDDMPCACFTVKHEAVSFIAQYPRDDLSLYSMSDGCESDPVWLNKDGT